MRKTTVFRRLLPAFTIVVLSGMVFCGCGEKEKESIHLSVWAPERKVTLVENAMKEFQKLHKDEVDIEFTVSKEEEDECKNTILGNVKGAADIFCFIDDQFDDLYEAGALLDMTSYTDKSADEFLAPVGGENSRAGEVVVRDGKVYGYPEVSGNCPFLYYNKKYFSEKDVMSIDGITDVCEKNNKLFSMDLSSGWYLYTFFKGAGLDIRKNATTGKNECNWNATDTEHSGVSVVSSIMEMARERSFVDLTDEDFVKKIEEKEVIAGVNGAWNADKIKEVWGDDMCATKLPTYTLGKDQVQMCSFIGYKAVGISANTKHPEWCMKFLEYCMTPEKQIEEFRVGGEAPANLEAIESDEVKKSIIVSAIAEQSKYGYTQRIADPFWDASHKLGVIISSKNKDYKDIQIILDKMVKETIS